MNPHRHYCPLDFKSSVSTDSTIRAFYDRHKKRAKNGVRTRDLNLGKVALYQLSYFRLLFISVNLHLMSYFVSHLRCKGTTNIHSCKFLSNFFYIFFLIYILSGTCIPNILKDSAMSSPIFLLRVTLKWRLLASSSPKMETF